MCSSLELPISQSTLFFPSNGLTETSCSMQIKCRQFNIFLIAYFDIPNEQLSHYLSLTNHSVFKVARFR